LLTNTNDALVADLIAAKVDVIFTSTTDGALAAKRATTTIPVVFSVAPDPVALHIVDSLAHPGGNLTGISPMFTDLTGKHLEILKDCLPGLSSAVLLNNPNSPFAGILAGNAQTAARAANIKFSIFETAKSDNLKQVFSVIAQQKAGAVIIPADPMLLYERKQIAELAVAHRLPTIGTTREMAEAGLLLSYGPEFAEIYRHAGVYIDKILKGAKPADLPVERATKFNLMVNLPTARAIGVTIPDSMQLLAAKIIE